MNISVVSYEKKHGRGEGTAGSSLIRARWLVDKWPEAKLWTNGQKADAMIFQKAYWKSMMEDFQGKKILDLCDPDWMGGDLKLMELAEHVGAITCSNQALTDFVQQVLPQKIVRTVPDRLNLDYFQERKKHTGRALRAVYFGYQHNANALLPFALPALARFGLELILVSNRPYSGTSGGVPIKYVKWEPHTAYQDIQTADFAINPSSGVSNFRYKSNNKTLISWGLGLPVANFADEIERFMDPVEREKESALRWDEIERDWRIEKSVGEYKEILATI